jgi:hypothetical protein
MAREKTAKGAPEERAPAASEEDLSDQDRRLRPRFRALIDEMLMQIRKVAREQQWTPEARLQAEADLERIMSQVRREAIVRSKGDSGG